ncbi:ATP-dependent DNA ligase [Paenibacillus harenae]|uniref:DNA ligase-1 n=1 Tax=Paenibacillus harenae TaxID=306543 RepID=A0ABT9U3W3_PAEHA|nr:RNA ligase family protein [Paenibacillus harenae]MDQ0114337.1 DNA ligase-1 [Paenibacillus harenae]
MITAPAVMLLQKKEEPFDDERYIFEPKIDGHRLILVRSGGKVKLYTRHENDVTARYPELHDVPVSCGDVILDGELAYMEPNTGDICFETTMRRFQMKGPKIKQGMLQYPVRFFVFDVLNVDGKDVRGLPLMERKAILDNIFFENEYYKRVMHVKGEGNALFSIIKERGLEGIVAKRKDSTYVGRRSDAWLKMINYTYAEVNLAGYRKTEFGWLALYNGRPAGVIELAVPAAHRKAFYSVAKSIVTGEDKNFVYIEPKIRAKVRFRNFNKSGLLRSPEFVDFVM